MPEVRYTSLEIKGGSNFSRVLRSVTQKHTASLSQGTERTKAAFDLLWLCLLFFFSYQPESCFYEDKINYLAFVFTKKT